ncbi:DUF3108 domain-containing protein [Dongia sedimenti]|uniref:DUF3108 domain-containing protein n=1 Tax=Dongia sedimenti TaxID=3064282 RepID=A0ABU0YQN1_9PROT|nr:DUF3108 domain-containing protein [Rhodospirillaceae bacterium R-7]
MPRLIGRLACLGFVVAFAVGLAPGPTRAQVVSAQIADLTYDVYVGGLHVFSFDVEMALQPGRYRVNAAGETRGMVGWLYDWNLNLAAEGVDRNGRIQSQLYVSESDWKSRERKVQLGFAGGGRYDLKQDPPPEPDPDIEGALPETLPVGTVDPLSFAIAASRSLAETGRCDQTLPVFDGQRRFDAIVKHLGAATLTPNKYSIYQGPAVRCSLGIARISGFRKSLRASSGSDAAPPIVWMASIRQDLPPVPVRYEGDIRLGKMVVHLTDAKFRVESAAAAAD